MPRHTPEHGLAVRESELEQLRFGFIALRSIAAVRNQIIAPG
jgi:hypothetical protein